MKKFRLWICRFFGQCVKEVELKPVYERLDRLEREVAYEKASWEALMIPQRQRRDR